SRPRRPGGTARRRRDAGAARRRRPRRRARPRDLAQPRGVPALGRPGARGAVRRAAPGFRRPGCPGLVKSAELGRTGLEISRVGVGAWAIGGAGYDWGWGSQNDEDSIAAIRHALE